MTWGRRGDIIAHSCSLCELSQDKLCYGEAGGAGQAPAPPASLFTLPALPGGLSRTSRKVTPAPWLRTLVPRRLPLASSPPFLPCCGGCSLPYLRIA